MLYTFRQVKIWICTAWWLTNLSIMNSTQVYAVATRVSLLPASFSSQSLNPGYFVFNISDYPWRNILPTVIHIHTWIIQESNDESGSNISLQIFFSFLVVEKTFPEVETITLRKNLRPPVTKQNIRMSRIPWTREQEEEFYLAVKRKGLGNWAEIRDYISFQRTNINLKDKWRQFYRSGKIEWLAKKFGKVWWIQAHHSLQ